MRSSLIVENIKCGGCVNQIESKLKHLVSEIAVDPDKGKVTFTHKNDAAVEEVKAALNKMGYPKIGGSKLRHKAKSYVSCMIGRINN